MNKFQHSSDSTHSVLLIGERCVAVDTPPVVTAKVFAHAITFIRQSLDVSSSAYLCYDRMTSVIERHRS